MALLWSFPVDRRAAAARLHSPVSNIRGDCPTIVEQVQFSVKRPLAHELIRSHLATWGRFPLPRIAAKNTQPASETPGI